MAPRSFLLADGPGPGDSVLDEGSPASIVERAEHRRVFTCECDGDVRGYSGSKKHSRITVIPRCEQFAPLAKTARGGGTGCEAGSGNLVRGVGGQRSVIINRRGGREGKGQQDVRGAWVRARKGQMGRMGMAGSSQRRLIRRSNVVGGDVAS